MPTYNTLTTTQQPHNNAHTKKSFSNDFSNHRKVDGKCIAFFCLLSITNTNELHGKKKHSPAAFCAVLSPATLLLFCLLFHLILLLFFHGELILGCGAQKCKLETDPFFPSKARIESNVLFPRSCDWEMAQTKSGLCNTTQLFVLFISYLFWPAFSHSPSISLAFSPPARCWSLLAAAWQITCGQLVVWRFVVKLCSCGWSDLTVLNWTHVRRLSTVCSVFALGLGKAGLWRVSR